MPETGLDWLIKEDIGIDEEKFVDALRANKIPQGEILLVAEEDPWVLVIWEVFVGEQLGELPRLVEVVLIAVVFDPKVEAVAAVAEQDQPAVRIRTGSSSTTRSAS